MLGKRAAREELIQLVRRGISNLLTKFLGENQMRTFLSFLYSGNKPPPKSSHRRRNRCRSSDALDSRSPPPKHRNVYSRHSSLPPSDAEKEGEQKKARKRSYAAASHQPHFDRFLQLPPM